jgi:hypothetical protein
MTQQEYDDTFEEHLIDELRMWLKKSSNGLIFAVEDSLSSLVNTGVCSASPLIMGALVELGAFDKIKRQILINNFQNECEKLS